jgi:hypothetical protein
MKRRVVTSLAALVCFLMVCGAAFAHHGAAAYDRTITLTLKATVTEFAFRNPHIQISFDAPDDTGKVVHWTVEGGSTAGWIRRGWTRNTLKPGDQVTIALNPARGMEGKDVRVGALGKITLANGQSGQDAAPRASEPRP